NCSAGAGGEEEGRRASAAKSGLSGKINSSRVGSNGCIWNGGRETRQRSTGGSECSQSQQRNVAGVSPGTAGRRGQTEPFYFGAGQRHWHGDVQHRAGNCFQFFSL